MLVIISDLHFIDGTAGKHNIPTEAFRIFLGNIAETVKRHRKKDRSIEEIKIVFLGDIFDLLRTEKWFESSVNVDERPWGGNEEKIEEHAKTIFNAVIKENQDTFDLLGGELKEEFGLPFEPERIYIPGNHDRLCDKYDSLRKMVCQSLRISRQESVPFLHHFEEPDYGVFYRHGHEFDQFNYEGGVSYGHQDYMRVPIGDPITSELVSRLPFTIKKRIENLTLPPEEKEKLIHNFQQIDNVRPLSAIIEWLLYQVKKDLNLKGIIEESVDDVIKKFNELEFVKKWYRHHDKWLDWWDEADQIQSVLWLLENFRIFPSQKLLSYLGKMKRNAAKKDEQFEAAVKEYSHLDGRIHYVVYGHTHDPLQIPVKVIETQDVKKEHFYLNTGTWRIRYQKAEESLGFTSFKKMTYVIFYKKEERGTDFPSFETWTGTLKTT